MRGTVRRLGSLVVRRSRLRRPSAEWLLMDSVSEVTTGIHLNIRLEQQRLCLLVLVGVRERHKELIALTDGHRESAGSWAGGPAARRETSRDARPNARDGRRRARGLERAARGVPHHQRAAGLVPQDPNVLSALPKSAHPGAKKALAEIWSAEDKDHARGAVKAFQDEYEATFPKATAMITDDLEELPF